MQVEAALLFETPEQIFARVFRHINPRTPVPAITVRFWPYASATSRIRLWRGCLEIKLSDLLEHAPAPVQEALAVILIAKLYRKPPAREALAVYRRYLNQADFSAQLHRVRRQRGRKRMRQACGCVHDLDALFDTLNQVYFNGQLDKPRLGWSARPSRTTLGHYDPAHHAIVISSLLDAATVPPLVIRYILFHEMLHIACPARHVVDRRSVHTKQFREAERAFSGLQEAKAALRSFLAGSARKSS